MTAAGQTAAACGVCGAASAFSLLHVTNVPVHSNVLMRSREQARAVRRGELDLAVCDGCGFAWNRSHREPDGGEPVDYDGSQAYSPRFMEHVVAQSRELVDRWGLGGRTVIEIGCGDGMFLSVLAELGVDALGFDPALPAERSTPSRARFVRARYGPAFFDQPADALVCRHTLEHIAQPLDFARMLRAACSASGARRVLLELPDFTRIIEQGAFWDVHYEHCGYFTPASLIALAERADFRALELRRVYDDQYLTLMLEPAATPAGATHAADSLPALSREQLTTFAARTTNIVRDWKNRIAAHEAAGEAVVLWGAGSKAASFLAHLQDSSAIRAIVDLNPRKHGSFQSGSGQEIVAPEHLAQLQPGLVIVMNRAYLDEIGRSLSAMGLAPRLLAL